MSVPVPVVSSASCECKKTGIIDETWGMMGVSENREIYERYGKMAGRTTVLSADGHRLTQMTGGCAARGVGVEESRNEVRRGASARAFPRRAWERDNEGISEKKGKSGTFRPFVAFSEGKSRGKSKGKSRRKGHNWIGSGCASAETDAPLLGALRERGENRGENGRTWFSHGWARMSTDDGRTRNGTLMNADLR